MTNNNADPCSACLTELASARQEVANLREYIAASEEVARAEDALWYADEYERLRAMFEKMVKQLDAEGEVRFNATGCEWCGAVLPKPDGEGLARTHQRVRRHIYSCESHPLKIERDALRSELASLKAKQAAGGEVEK